MSQDVSGGSNNFSWIRIYCFIVSIVLGFGFVYSDTETTKSIFQNSNFFYKLFAAICIFLGTFISGNIAILIRNICRPDYIICSSEDFLTQKMLWTIGIPTIGMGIASEGILALFK